MKARGDRWRSGGFSFVEVLVALAIFVMASVILTTSLLTAMTVRERSGSRSLLEADLRLVRQQLLLETNIEDARRGAEVETFGGGLAIWRAEIEPTELINLFAVTLEVRFPTGEDEYAGDHIERLYLLRPTWAQREERSMMIEDKRQALERERRFR